MELNLDQLNKKQKQAVSFDDGPLLIVAGAGTGKTTVIAQRIVFLLSETKASPEEILAVTYTDKAAGEMEERVDWLLKIGYTDIWISTFHSFCERVLREEGIDIGISTDFKIVDQTSSWILARRNFNKFDLNYYKPLGNPAKFLHALLAHFSRCKDQGIYPEDYLDYAETLKTNLTDLPEGSEEERIKEIASAYHIYQKLLLDNNILDFGDLINYCLKLFQKRPHILEKYRKQFKYILVDEFQDANWAQYELVKMLAFPKNNLTVCGDHLQAIYRFRGASFANIIRFKKDFPKLKEVSLIKNYRSTQNILDLSFLFIKDNNPGASEYFPENDLKLFSQNKEKGLIEHLHFRTLSDETQGVANKIIELLKTDKSSTFSDFVVLVRANDSANAFCRTFERANIPYQFLASRGLYSKPIVLDIISYFKLLDNYRESIALHRVLNLPFLKINNESIMKINYDARRKGKSVFEVLKELPLVYGIDQESAKSITFLLGLIERHSALSKSKNVSEILLGFMRDSGYLKFLLDKEDRDALSNLTQFHRKIKEFEEGSLDPLLKSFMEQLNLELESGEQGKLEFDLEQGPDLVRVMTIHGSKGLEFKYVFIVNAVDRRFPTTKRKEAIEIPVELIKEEAPKRDVHIEEERRLCYVAMTRAKKGLFFTSASDYGGQRKKRPSRFLKEMGFKEQDENVSKGKRIDAKEKKALSFILPSHFSFSQIATFSRCPLQYKYAYLFKVPVEGKAVFSFGQTMHATLYEFVKRAKSPKTKQKDLFGQEKEKKGISLEELNEIFEKKWIDEWYEDKNQQKEYHKLGKNIIKSFYEDFQEESPDILKIKGELALELPFRLKIGDYTILGRIDRIDKVEGGVRIIDYKTGKAKEKLYPGDKQQLLIYQIALEEVFKLNPVELSYHYLEKGKKVSFLGSGQEKEKQKQEVLEKIDEIKKSDFNAMPGFHCQFCDFKGICDYA